MRQKLGRRYEDFSGVMKVRESLTSDTLSRNLFLWSICERNFVNKSMK